MSGLYCVFEGIEGSGKSTAMRTVSAVLAERGIKHIVTRHPGQTPLGAHLRKLAKYPEQIDERIVMDAKSTQLLMVADAVNFNKTVLIPALEAGTVVLADRCNPISMLAYGLADGLSYCEIDKLLGITEPVKPDKLFIMDCEPTTSYVRMVSQNGGDGVGLDRFERKGLPYVERLYKVYKSLMSGDPELVTLARQCVNFQSVRYIDATQTQSAIALQISKDIVTALHRAARS